MVRLEGVDPEVFPALPSAENHCAQDPHPVSKGAQPSQASQHSLQQDMPYSRQGWCGDCAAYDLVMLCRPDAYLTVQQAPLPYLCRAAPFGTLPTE